MTIGAAWIRKGAFSDEIWMAADSRLSGDGYVWDQCPKLLPLPRQDAVAGFSGSTGQAYPLLLQVANATRAYRPAEDGTLEFFEWIGHLERVINAMMAQLLLDPAVSRADPDWREFSSGGDVVVVGGFSRAAGSVTLRALQYQGTGDAWRFSRVRASPSLGNRRIVRLFGDNRARSRYRFHLTNHLVGRRRDEAFDFEPLEVIAEMLRMPVSTDRRLPQGHRPETIGGSPQVVRVMPGGVATPFVVRWGDQDYLLGRRVLGYERLDLPQIVFGADGVQLHAPGNWVAAEGSP